jgi:membrane associated rhomboid family serine protease
VFLPAGDHPRLSRRRSHVTRALIAANVLVHGYGLLAHGGAAGHAALLTEWGFVPVAPRLETFFTHLFLHAGILHLAGNLLFLGVFGDNVEGRLGHGGYLLVYLAGGLAAALLFAALEPASGVPLVGASGAVFAVEGFYFLAFPRNRVRVVYWLFVVGVAWVPARLLLGLSFVWNLVWLLSPAGAEGGGGVAWAAHVGGFLLGLSVAGALRLGAGPAEGRAA